MKVIVINGSPSLKKGMTHQLISHFTKGCEAAGAEVEQIDLQSMKLKYCSGCLHCFYSTEHLCIHKDGMAEIHEKLLKSDYMVLATPVYADGITGQLKTFMDRFVPLIDVRFEIVDGHYRHIKRFEKLPKVALLSVCGFYEMDNFDAVEEHVKKFTHHIQSEFAGSVLRPSSPILAMDKIFPDVVKNIKNAIEQSGVELIKNGSFSEDTLEKITYTPLNKEQWLFGTNKYHENCLKAGKFIGYQY